MSTSTNNVGRPQRPSMAQRQVSSSSFAEQFESARTQLDHIGIHEPSVRDILETDDDCQDFPDLSTTSSPSLATSDSSASLVSANVTPLTPVDQELATADDFAFAFDIDGVLVRGGKPIPAAVEAMKVLNGQNQYNLRIPYIFLTNGGGKFETERCNDLSVQLEIDVSPGQFICGHTPMREFADRYRTVLVVGGEGEKCRQVAESYGFKDVVTPGDILKANSATAPFRKLTATEHANSRDLLARGNLSDIVVEAIFVFADSRDWACDLQIIIDLAQSKGGRLETRSETLDEGPPIFFSHNDILWSAEHEHSRLGMGALRKTVETIFESTSGGKKLKTHAFGKPQVSTFEFADRLLRQWRAQQHGLADSKAVKTVYFVGDTPESDVRGTNAMNEKAKNNWYSILVKTGVYQDGTTPAYRPRALVDNVLDAVNHAIEREMKKKALCNGGTAKGSTLPIETPKIPEHVDLKLVDNEA